MPALADLSAEQRAAVDEVRVGPRGDLLACFVPLLRSPALMSRVQRVGEYLRYQGTLSDHHRELVILCVARWWDQEFEWFVHRGLAEGAGLSVEVIEAIGEGRRPEAGPPDVMAVFDLIAELHSRRDVSDPIYERALDELGEVCLAEAIGTAGYYTLLAMLMNATHTSAPDGPRLPPRTGSAL